MFGQVILNFLVHSAIITMKTKTNINAVATTDGVRTQYESPTQIELELII